jgi:hypothetical protein
MTHCVRWLAKAAGMLRIGLASREGWVHAQYSWIIAKCDVRSRITRPLSDEASGGRMFEFWMLTGRVALVAIVSHRRTRVGFGLGIDTMLLAVGKYGDMMVSDPADAEGDVVVI